jgi:menaquinol-cytochrome c reductase iron-sulfur subunit
MHATGSESPPGNRRSFIGALLALGSLCVGGLLSVPLIRFALFPILRRTTELKLSPVGPLSAFSSLTEPVLRTVQIEQVDGWRDAISEKDVYVTTDAHGKLCVLSSVCPHLGCTVSWVGDKHQFICPCHVSIFAADGTRISGPSLRGMDSLDITVRQDQLLVRFEYFRQLVAEKEVMS